MRRLPPTLRLKRRYLVLEGQRREIERAILEYIGLLGWSKAAPSFEMHKSRIILAINRETLVDIRAALALADIKIVKVSGTLKGLE